MSLESPPWAMKPATTNTYTCDNQQQTDSADDVNVYIFRARRSKGPTDHLGSLPIVVSLIYIGSFVQSIATDFAISESTSSSGEQFSLDFTVK